MTHTAAADFEVCLPSSCNCHKRHAVQIISSGSSVVIVDLLPALEIAVPNIEHPVHRDRTDQFAGHWAN